MKNLRALSLAAVLGLLSAVAGSAATLTFHGTVLSGPSAGATATGFATWDETALTGIGIETLRHNQGAGPLLAVELNIFGQTFTASDDVDFSGTFPALLFNAGVPSLLDFIIGSSNTPPGVSSIGTGNIFQPAQLQGYDYFIEINVSGAPTQVIPEPGTYALMGGALAGLLFLRRRASR
jgi:hypothetical protein